MKNRFMQSFGFSKRELNGLLFLVILILLLTGTPYIYRYISIQNRNISSKEHLALQKLILMDRYEKRDYTNYQHRYAKGFAKPVAKYEKFDPNTADEKLWQQFGLSLKQAMSIVNYVKKGGKFRTPEDLKKMYTISPEKYEALLPYVNIQHSDEKVSVFERKQAFERKALVIVEVNTADTLQLDQIKGIGASFARRIVKYRERLGGFYEKEQLLEVFGLDTPKFLEVKEQIKIDLSAIKKMNINTATFETLKHHPYLKYKEMNAIIQYRNQHGNYKGIHDLRKILILKPQTIDKIAPYLEF